MPTGDEMFRLLKALDLTYKTEMIFVSISGYANRADFELLFCLVPIAWNYFLVQRPGCSAMGNSSLRIFRCAKTSLAGVAACWASFPRSSGRSSSEVLALDSRHRGRHRPIWSKAWRSFGWVSHGQTQVWLKHLVYEQGVGEQELPASVLNSDRTDLHIWHSVLLHCVLQLLWKRGRWARRGHLACHHSHIPSDWCVLLHVGAEPEGQVTPWHGVLRVGRRAGLHKEDEPRAQVQSRQGGARRHRDCQEQAPPETGLEKDHGAGSSGAKGQGGGIKQKEGSSGQGSAKRLAKAFIGSLPTKQKSQDWRWAQ